MCIRDRPYSTEGYGSVTRAMGGQHISYCLGDASHAYRSISNDPMWVDYFKQAGIEQTPENGFGATPLTKYRRHVLMLHPHTVIAVSYTHLSIRSMVENHYFTVADTTLSLPTYIVCCAIVPHVLTIRFW